MKIRLYRLIQPVTDIDEAERFYAAVLCNEGERVSPGRHYFQCGGVVLACYDPVKDGDEMGEGWHQHVNEYIYFSVDNLEATLKRVSDSGGQIEGEIQSMPWGERMFYAKDPFGNPISFVDEETLFTGSGSNL